MRWRDAELLHLYLGSGDRIAGETAFDWLLRSAAERGLLGATVLQGSLGFGPDGVVQRAALFRPHRNLPVLIEIVDTPERLGAWLEAVRPQLPGGTLTTRQPVRLLDRADDDR